MLNYWWLFLIFGVLLTGYAIPAQVRRMRQMGKVSERFMKDLGSDYLGGFTRPRESEPDVWAGLAVQMLAGFLGCISLLIGVVLLIIIASKS